MANENKSVMVFGDMRPLVRELKAQGVTVLTMASADGVTRTDILEFVTKNQPSCVVNASTFTTPTTSIDSSLVALEQSLSLVQVTFAQKMVYVQLSDARVFSGTPLDKNRVTYNPYDPVMATKHSLPLVSAEHQCLSFMLDALPRSCYLFRVGVLFDKSVGLWSSLYREVLTACSEDSVVADFGQYNGTPVTMCDPKDIANAVIRVISNLNDAPNGVYHLGTRDHLTLQRMFMEYALNRAAPVTEESGRKLVCQSSLALNTEFWYNLTKTPTYSWRGLLSSVDVDLTAIKD
jgi:dTDP-4-dehydrorhamnose reductase